MLHDTLGHTTHAVELRIDPGMDLVFLTEVTLSKSLPCLRGLARPGIPGVWLRRAQLEWHALDGHSTGRGGPTLAALESGNCFLMANDQKVPIATFSNASRSATNVAMDLLPPTNLLEFLRAEHFTLEISGANRRHLTQPLPLRLKLEFDTQAPILVQDARATRHRSYPSAAT